jgi:hypothetical protein
VSATMITWNAETRPPCPSGGVRRARRLLGRQPGCGQINAAWRRSCSPSGMRAELLDHADELGERRRGHLRHHASAVHRRVRRFVDTSRDESRRGVRPEPNLEWARGRAGTGRLAPGPGVQREVVLAAIWTEVDTMLLEGLHRWEVTTRRHSPHSFPMIRWAGRPPETWWSNRETAR